MRAQPLSRVRVDELDTAARRMMETALRVQSGQQLVVLSDAASSRLGDAVARAGLGAGARVVTYWLDEEGERPLQVLPDAIAQRLERADATVFVAGSSPEELPMRQQLLHLVGTMRLRHAHLPGISALAFARGMRVDYDEVAKHGRRLLPQLERANVLAVSSSAGTALRVYLSPPTEWFAQLGELQPGRWGNLPAGALFATPESVHGTIVANAALGEPLAPVAGSLATDPVTLTIRDGRVTEVQARRPQLRRDIEDVLAFGPNSDRVGLVCVGVNFGIREATGEAIVDQNMPGLHLCVGDPAARVTGASWSAPTSFAVCQSGSFVRVEDEVVVRDGRLVVPS